MASTIIDPSLQTVQPSNSGGTQPFDQQAKQINSQNNTNPQTNQGVTFNQTPSNGQGQQSTSTGRNQPQGTGFTNVSNILSANQGNNLGQTIQSGISNTANNVNQSLQSAQGSFNQGVNANTFGASDQTNVNNTINAASNLKGGQTVDPTQLAQFQNYTAGGYQGPSGLQNSTLLQGQAQAAQQLGQDVTSSGGQQNLLQQFVGNSQYGQGQQTLDQLLLGQQQGALNQAEASTAGLGNKALSDINNASQVATQAVAGNQAFGQQALLAAQNAQTPINTAVNNSVTTDLQNQNNLQYQFNQLQNILKQTPDQYNTSVNALAAPSATATAAPAAPSTGQEEVNQLNAIFSNLQSAGVDPNTIQQLAGPALQANISNIPGYIQSLQNNITLNNPNPLAVSNPTTSNYGTLNYTPSASDVSALQNQQAVMSSQQAAQLNALSQLAGGTGNINGTGVGTYNPSSIGVNLNGIIPQTSQTVGGGVTPTPTPSLLSSVGNTIAGIDEGIGGALGGATTASLAGDTDNQVVNAVGQLSSGNVGGAASTAIKAPLVIGTQLANQINGNPLGQIPIIGSALGGIGNPLSSVTTPVISVASNIANAIANPVAQVFGGGGGKIICNELHRQGYISDRVIQLDEAYGKKFRKYHREAYIGYLIVAGPIVNLMRKSPLFTHMISKISLPWSSFMANKMDATIKGSILGRIINDISIVILPNIYKINKLFKRVKNEYKMV